MQAHDRLLDAVCHNSLHLRHRLLTELFRKRCQRVASFGKLLTGATNFKAVGDKCAKSSILIIGVQLQPSRFGRYFILAEDGRVVSLPQVEHVVHFFRVVHREVEASGCVISRRSEDLSGATLSKNHTSVSSHLLNGGSLITVHISLITRSLGGDLGGNSGALIDFTITQMINQFLWLTSRFRDVVIAIVQISVHGIVS